MIGIHVRQLKLACKVSVSFLSDPNYCEMLKVKVATLCGCGNLLSKLTWYPQPCSRVKQTTSRTNIRRFSRMRLNGVRFQIAQSVKDKWAVRTSKTLCSIWVIDRRCTLISGTANIVSWDSLMNFRCPARPRRHQRNILMSANSNSRRDTIRRRRGTEIRWMRSRHLPSRPVSKNHISRHTRIFRMVVAGTECCTTRSLSCHFNGIQEGGEAR